MGLALILFYFTSFGLIVDLGQPMLPQKCVDLICVPQVVENLSILGLAHRRKLD